MLYASRGDLLLSYPLPTVRTHPGNGTHDLPHLARAMVAIEMPVEPTVPSNMRDPVCGLRNPSFSASSITDRRSMNGTTEGRCRLTAQGDSILDASAWVQELCSR
jgi:hypothetical protein